MKLSDQSRFIIALLVLYFFAGGACVYTERANPSEVPKFDTWQVSLQSDGYPRLRYLNLASQTSYVMAYRNSTSCADVKFEYRRFIEQDVYVPVDSILIGAFAINGKRFDFPATVPTVTNAATLQVIEAVWTPGFPFFSELIKADRIHWRDNAMLEDEPSIEISMEGFGPMLNIAMDICHEKYLKNNPPNKIRKGRATFAMVTP